MCIVTNFEETTAHSSHQQCNRYIVDNIIDNILIIFDLQKQFKSSTLYDSIN